jgi:hypothetical protein
MTEFKWTLSQRSLSTLALIALFVMTAGCSTLATFVWVVNPKDVDAEYDGLKEQRVAVVCRMPGGLSYQHHGVPKRLTESVNQLLRTNVDKIDVVAQADIEEWTDHHELTSFKELGMAMNADAVVVLELTHFGVRKGRTTLQGEATVEAMVYDVKTGDVEHRLQTIDSLYPPNNGIAAEISDDRFESRFSRRFIAVLADQVARRFYDHDSRHAVKIDRFYQQ